MDRNPDRGTDGTLYSWKSPPLSEEGALRRVNELDLAIAQIETDLEHKSLASFGDQEEYDAWQRRATAALGWKRAEKKYVEGWIRGIEKRREKEVALQNQAERLRILEELKEGVSRLAADIKAAYTRVYSASNPPDSLDKAKERHQLVHAITERIHQEFSEVKTIASRHGIAKREVKLLLLPLHRVFQRIRLEEGYLFLLLRGDNDAALAYQKAFEFAHDLSDDLERQWEAEDADAQPPKDAEEARARLKQLGKRELQAHDALRQLKDACHDGGPLFSAASFRNLKLPLEELLDMVQREVDELKKSFVSKSGSIGSGGDSYGNADLSAIAESIRDRAKQLSEEIGSEVSQLLDSDEGPESVEAAKEALQRVTEIRQRLQSALGEVGDLWVQHPLRRDDMSSVKRPLTQLLYKVESKTQVLKAYIAEHNKASSAMRFRRWKHVCVSALTRAVMSGFQLTEEEKVVLQELIAELAPKD